MELRSTFKCTHTPSNTDVCLLTCIIHPYSFLSRLVFIKKPKINRNLKEEEVVQQMQNVEWSPVGQRGIYVRLQLNL